jgi:type IV pilus assembly protein PilN
MIRINLLGRQTQKSKRGFAIDVGQRITIASSLILILAGLGIGWWYWALNQASAQVDADIAAAQQEIARLQSLLAEVKTFEDQRTLLQQRVALIEQLRRGQSVPVQLLDHVSRSLPDMLWLTSLQQSGGDVTLEGRSTTLIALSDFVGNLGNGTLLQRPIEIVNSQVESMQAGGRGGAVEVIRFTVRARLAPADPPAGGRGAAPAAAGSR